MSDNYSNHNYEARTTHTHHHHHHSVDGSERDKRHRLSAAKRRKLIGKILFALLSVLALIIMMIVAWMYWPDK